MIQTVPTIITALLAVAADNWFFATVVLVLFTSAAMILHLLRLRETTRKPRLSAESAPCAMCLVAWTMSLVLSVRCWPISPEPIQNHSAFQRSFVMIPLKIRKLVKRETTKLFFQHNHRSKSRFIAHQILIHNLLTIQ